MSALNLAVRFACELAAIAALVWWGWPLLGILAGAAVIVVWGAFIGPKAPRRLRDPYRLVVELGIFVLATIGFQGGGADGGRGDLRGGRARQRAARSRLAGARRLTPVG